jgi:hypothetical protein
VISLTLEDYLAWGLTPPAEKEEAAPAKDGPKALTSNYAGSINEGIEFRNRKGPTANICEHYEIPTGAARTEPTPAVLGIYRLGKAATSPKYWGQHLTNQAGTADAVACRVLAAILPWYRPTVKGEHLTKKFHGDFLQRDIGELADETNHTERQVKDALLRLQRAGAIRRHYRILPKGLSNVLFIELIPGRVAEISQQKAAGGMTSKRRTSDGKKGNKGQRK